LHAAEGNPSNPKVTRRESSRSTPASARCSPGPNRLSEQPSLVGRVQIPPTVALATVGGICCYEPFGETRWLLNMWSAVYGHGATESGDTLSCDSHRRFVFLSRRLTEAGSRIRSADHSNVVTGFA